MKYFCVIRLHLFLESAIHKKWRDDDELTLMTLYYEILFNKHLKGYNVCITHDLMLLPMYLPINIAIRKFSSIDINIKWFHWIHSKPDVKIFDTQIYKYINNYPLLNNSYITYPNSSDCDDICKFFKIQNDQFINIYNSIDLDIFFKQSERVKTIIQKYKIDIDFIIIYPTRLNYSKRIDKILELVKYLKAKELNPLFIVCNTYNNDQSAKLLFQYYSLLNKYNSIDTNVIFTSELGINDGLNNDEIKTLFNYSSFFIFPTISETCPLVMLEAMLCSNILVLNKHLECLKEVADDEAYYIDFNLNNNLWMEACFKIITYELANNKLLKARNKIIKKFNTKVIYDNFNSKLKRIIQN